MTVRFLTALTSVFSLRAVLALLRRPAIGNRMWIAMAVSLCLGTAPAASAQTIGLNLADSARLVVAPNGKLTVPLKVDLTSAGASNLASLQTGVFWGSSRLTFDSIRVNASTGFSLTPNTSAAGSGSIEFNAFGASALAGSGTLATVYFTASASSGGTRVSLTPSAAGSEVGASVLSLLRVRNVDVCVAPSGKWGDVTDDGNVNIIDAQQIARYSVSLSVANAAVLVVRGDVTADGNVNIIDAQQIARASVSLSAAARIGTALFIPPPVSTVSITPSGAQSLALGATLALSATPRDSVAADIGGCQTVTWASSAPGIATVSTDGLVTGVSVGSTTITASSGGRSATVSVTVAPPLNLSMAAQPGNGTSNEFLSAQPAVELHNNSGTLVTNDPQTVTAAIASGSGTLSGTTSVVTVNGVATFTDLAITGTGSHTLSFSSSAATGTTSGAVSIAAPTSMRFLVNAVPSLAVTSGTDVAIPLLVDMSGCGSANLASLTVTVSWDPAKFSYVTNSAGNWVDQTGGGSSVTLNTTSTASGSISMTGFTTDATISSFTLRTLTLRPLASGSAVVSAAVTTAGNVSGSAVTMVPRGLGVGSGAPPGPTASVQVTPATATIR